MLAHPPLFVAIRTQHCTRWFYVCSFLRYCIKQGRCFANLDFTVDAGSQGKGGSPSVALAIAEQTNQHKIDAIRLVGACFARTRRRALLDGNGFPRMFPPRVSINVYEVTVPNCLFSTRPKVKETEELSLELMKVDKAEEARKARRDWLRRMKVSPGVWVRVTVEASE